MSIPKQKLSAKILTLNTKCANIVFAINKATYQRSIPKVMCNIAGYVGNKNAAPILIEMLRREEGFDAGYYTGIATLHEGKIYYRKVAGDLDTLLKKTDAISLPGNIGIIHSRTPSGGPDEWAHPFVSCGTNAKEPIIAYVANGNSGVFKERDPEYNGYAEELMKSGYTLDSEIDFPDGIYNRLSNGKMVHMSDVMCALIASEIDRGADPCNAITNAFCKMPGEIVGLLLSLNTPDKITYSKINRPMFLSFASHGAYLATTAIAHLDDAGDPINLPELSSGYVTASGFTSQKYPTPPIEVTVADAKIEHDAYDLIVKMLSEGRELTFNDLKIHHLFPKKEGAVVSRVRVMYSVLHSLYREGRLEIKSYTLPGAVEGTTAKLFKLKLKDK